MNDDFSLPSGLVPPPPPPGLRPRALAAARAALEAPAPDIWSRALASPALRLAWAASIALLTAAHVLLPARRASPPDRDPQEIRQIAHLPRIDSRSLPDEAPPAPPAPAEKRS